MIKTDVRVELTYTEEDVRRAVAKALPVEVSEIRSLKILKRALVSLDSDIHYKITVALSFDPERERGLLKMKKKVSEAPDYSFEPITATLDHRPVVIGAGPAGLFCALYLAECGARPIVLERGLPVEERCKKVDRFNLLGELDPECNIQFGEGGAGTYSDGKLKVGSMDKYKMKVLSEFVKAGANEDILYSVGAHLGTDRLSDIVKALREKIVSLGGEVLFSSRMTSLNVKNGELCGVKYIRESAEYEIPTRTAILATGHSAEDTFRVLNDLGLVLEPRGFGIGVRIEHPREYIDELVYRRSAPEGAGTASYHLVTHLPSGRSVYSFCMCPGGTVVAATGTEGCVVTNGMSEYDRMGDNSNAALLVSVTPGDFGGDALGGIRYQRQIERCVFELAGSDYKAPAIRVCDFLDRSRVLREGSVKPTYPRGTELISPDAYLPDFVAESLRLGVLDFDRWMRGYNYGDAVITGAETRSTSPIRVVRGEDFSAVGFKGIYPIGEGAGYSGGIVSSATDGVRCAEAIIKLNK